MTEGAERKSGCSSSPVLPSSSASCLLSSFLFPLPQFPLLRLALPVFLSRGGIRLPTSVVERKSKTRQQRLASARRFRILNQSFPLPTSFRGIYVPPLYR